MNNKDINEAIAQLANIDWQLATAFEENGGEVTPELQQQLDQQENLRTLLEGEGIDSLGRWLKSVEDSIMALKAERDSINRRIKAHTQTVAYIKSQLRNVMDSLGLEKAKGVSYSFRIHDSGRTSLDGDAIDHKWLDVVTEAARAAGLPGYLDVAIDTTTSRLLEWADEHEGEGSEYVHTETTPTVTFVKPRANKDTAVENW